MEPATITTFKDLFWTASFYPSVCPRLLEVCANLITYNQTPLRVALARARSAINQKPVAAAARGALAPVAAIRREVGAVKRGRLPAKKLSSESGSNVVRVDLERVAT